MSLFTRLVPGTLLLALVLGAGCSNLPAAGKLDRTDRAIEQNLVDRLSFDDVTARGNFGVRVQNGVATVFGVVRDDVVRLRVLSIAEGTPGVQEVRDELQRR